MFLWLLDKDFGLANWALGKVGLGPFGFFADPSQALPSLAMMTVWGWLGFDTIVYLAALQGVPHELVEAAAIDGAGRWSTFRNVTLPLLGPATLLLVVWSTISALQLFDEVYFVTRGGPLDSTSVVVYPRVPAGVHVGGAGGGIRGGHRVRAVRGDPDPHAGPVLAGQPGGALPGMSATTADPAHRRRPATTEEGEVGANPRRRWLPFSPWHLVLMPMALIMLVPLVWMVITSLETLDQTRHFPPMLWPGSCSSRTIPNALRAAPFAALVLEHAVVTVTVVAANLLLCSLAAYAFARMRFLGKKAVYFVLLATLMVPLQVVLVPTFLIVKELGLINHLGRADRAEPGQRVRHLHAHAVLPHAADRAGGGRAHRRRVAPEDPVHDRAAAVGARRSRRWR